MSDSSSRNAAINALGLLLGVLGLGGLSNLLWQRLTGSMPIWVGVALGVALAVLLGIHLRLRRAHAASATLPWHRPDDMSAFHAALAEAEQRVVLIGISLSGLFNPSEQQLRSFLARSPHATLHAYLLDPDCDNLVERAAHEASGGDIGPEVMERDIRSFGARLRALSPNRVTLKTYDWYPTWRLQMVDEAVIFAASYPPNGRGISQKVLEVRKATQPELFEVLHNVVRSYERDTTHVGAWPAS